MNARRPSILMMALVRLLPRAFREEYGAAILEAHETARAERRVFQGRLSALQFTMRSALDVVVTAGRERKRGWVRRRVRFELGPDLRRPFRMMARSPGFTVAAVGVLALGIGVNAAIFTAVKALLLSSPPYPDPDRLVLVEMSGTMLNVPGRQPFNWSYPKFDLYRRDEGRRIDPIAAFARRTALLVSGEQSARVAVELVSPAYLTLLGARPVVGRLFSEAEGEPQGSALVAVLSHAAWLSRFGGDAAVVGRTIELESKVVEVIGVAAADFDGLTGGVDVWVPVSAAATLYTPFMISQPRAHWLQGIGRLREGATVEQARSHTEAAVRRIEAIYPPTDPTAELGASVRLLSDARRNPAARTAVLVLAGAALLVLLIACANLAGLLLARGVARRREIAVQAALGGSRSRIVLGLLWESLVLAGLGGFLGLLVAHFGVQLLRAMWPERFAMSDRLRVLEVGSLALDPVAVGFALALTLMTAMLFGLLPALNLAGVGPGEVLGSGTRVMTSARIGRRMDGRSVLIAVEVALALVLLVGAGLMTASMTRLIRVDRGFDADRLLTFEYNVPRNSRYAESPARLHDELLERLAGSGRIQSAAVGCIAPLSGHCAVTEVSKVEGRAPFPLGSLPPIGVHAVSDRYFETLRVPIIAGRAFDSRDTESSALVTIINRTAAQTLFGKENPLGRTLSMGYHVREDQETYTIVGVVGDVLYDRPEQGVMAEAYIPLRLEQASRVTGMVRTAGEPLLVAPLVVDQMRALEPGAVVYSIATAQQLAGRATADTRVLLSLLSLFAISAVLLAAFGIWSVVAYTVNQRRQELGLRMALGARGSTVVSWVVGRGARSALAGVCLGIPVAYVVSRLLESLLFEVRRADPFVYAAAAVALSFVALLASTIPALRAARIDPMQAMKTD